MKSMKQNLQAVSKALKALAKKAEVLMKELNKFEKSQPATKPKTKAVKARVPKKNLGVDNTISILPLFQQTALVFLLASYAHLIKFEKDSSSA